MILECLHWDVCIEMFAPILIQDNKKMFGKINKRGLGEVKISIGEAGKKFKH